LSSSRTIRPGRRFGKPLIALLWVVLALMVVTIVVDEVRTSRHQAAWLSGVVRDLSFQVETGPSRAIRFPGNGPYDQRLGYHLLPQWVDRLARQGFEVTAQARASPRLLAVSDDGLFATYHEKSQAGLTLLDCRSATLFAARFPERVYDRFDAVPQLLVASLLFIENHDLLDAQTMRNPAVEWDRFAKAVVDQMLRRLDRSHRAAGGSTLATQIEKYRHSPDGRTESAADKLRQMASASLRGYLDGENTLARRRQIVLDYVNTVPLSARPGIGEVNGLGDGLWAWFGRDFDQVNRLLTLTIAQADPGEPRRTALAFRQALLPRQALAYKQALALMVAQRRPGLYLSAQQEPALRELTDSYLRVMTEAGVIPATLRDAALPQALALQTQLFGEPVSDSSSRPPSPASQTSAALRITPVRASPAFARPSFAERKAATAVRGKLQTLLGIPRAYDLDRLDLRVDSSLSAEVQHSAGVLLRSLSRSESARAAGLYGFHLFNEGDDPSKITYSFTLYERTANANLLRAQTDNLDQPFDLNEGARLDLGSTAKLRTLITYLEQVERLHQRWGALDVRQLAALKLAVNDALAHWARDHLVRAASSGSNELAAMLEAALARVYPASPAEAFFTGGGVHRFGNFEPEDDGRSLSVRDAFARSVNLVFIRLIRDVVRHEIADNAETSAPGDGPSNAALFDNPADPRRLDYLRRFADREGREFIARFHAKYAGLSRAVAEDLLLQGVRATPVHLASLFYGLEPQAGADDLATFLSRRLPGTQGVAPKLHQQYQTDRWSLTDRAYLAGVHPLELWVAGHLRAHTQASLEQTLAAGREQSQVVYGWLFKTRNKKAQDERIRGLIELDAFAEIHRSWQRLGYPFASLTPSYATALGASGDRPAALAELMGIIVNRGLRLPVTRIKSLRFAEATPYETRLSYQPPAASRVLSTEVATAVRSALIGVVEEGTARRLKAALVRRDGSGVEIGGKTGTGDHRFDVFGRGGQLISSRIVDRSATLVFFIGERFFGTIMAYVHEPDAEKYKFTSALPAQLLKALTPVLRDLVDQPACELARARRKDEP
jgi:membrane peptidoglycan carboxypeptidase